MNKKEYAQYLGQLIDEEIDVESEYLEDQFYGFFQYFMPDGENLEKVFEPLAQADLFYQRIKPIFKATEENTLKVFQEGASPGYFIPTATKEIDEVKTCGQQLLTNFKLLAAFLQDEELVRTLEQVQEVRLIESAIIKKMEEHAHQEYLFDTLTDWMNEQENTDDAIDLLTEAYYSIACDYWLSMYLQYPRYQQKPDFDVFKPYFELWQKGYRFKLSADALLLFK